jgi:uncharacterized protein YbjQ (UPF0145 family)
MRNRLLVTILVSMFTLTGAGCARHAGLGYGRSTSYAAAHDTDADHDDDHDHAPEGPITPTLQAAADRVLVLQGSAGRACEVLGLIDEHGRMGQEDEALARLRRDAARMGGDALIHVEFHHAGDEHHEEGAAGHDEEAAGAESTSFSGEHEADPDVDADVDEGSDPMALHLSGTVVRFHDLVAGRHYEIIRRLVVYVPMTHEEDGLAELRREGRALHADLLLDVEFHHGHGTEPLEVDGTAVRFTQ